MDIDQEETDFSTATEISTETTECRVYYDVTMHRNYINREHLIRDGFAEVENQQQNVVESGGIHWLKSAIHVLLDMTGAPACTWFLAATYLADVHNHTWNVKMNKGHYDCKSKFRTSR
jgi:hypothetical protein